MAREQPGHTLQPTALVHEAWLRLGDQRFENRAHFFGATAAAMRRILVDRARRKGRDKRGAGAEHVDVDELLRVHEVLDRLAVEDPQKAELVKLRFFVGLSLAEAGAVLGLSERTAKRHWAYARAWLFEAIEWEENPAVKLFRARWPISSPDGVWEFRMKTPMPPPPPPRPSGSPIQPALPPPRPLLAEECATRAEATFNSALERPRAERAAFVAGACGDDADVQARVGELLATHERAEGFLQDEAPLSPEIKEQLARLKPEEAGETIGPYKLREQIGEGGFGTVWVADQEKPVRRRVALKIIKLGMDTKAVIARFEQERQALAMMDHPNIAKILDAGVTQWGRPFFIMELVKGMPITKYCAEAGLTTRERLALFSDVCSAINHAHQKGIIHRDIKPSNVMVTLHGDKAAGKVIDFGIAKATQGRLTDETVYTQFQQMIGTPAYMSPEQAGMSGLDVDTRSDIYALGILLYELLVGKPPFDGKSLLSAGYEEMRRIIREVEPPRPSSRLKTMAGEERLLLAKSHRIEPEKIGRLVEPDLDWIVMKAIEKDRTQRYETASAFARDIARFLADEPVTATPPSTGYQFRKFARRNKVALRVATAIAAVLVAATAVSTRLAVRAMRAETLAAQEMQRTKAALGDAEATSKFLTDMFGSAQPGETKGGREVKVADVLDRAVAELEVNQTLPPARRATLQARLGGTYGSLGLPKQAMALREMVREFALATHGPEHPDTLTAMQDLAASYSAAGRRDEALKMREEVLAVRRKVLGPEHPDTLGAMNNLAISYSDADRQNEALKLREEVLPLRRKVLGPEHSGTLRAMSNLAVSYSDAGRRDEALKLREEVLPLRRKLLGPEHPDTLKAMSSLAASLSSVGRWDEALRMGEDLLALCRKVLGPEHPDTLTALEHLAVSSSEAGRKNETLKLREEVLPLRRKLLGPEHPDTLRAMSSLAWSLATCPDPALRDPQRAAELAAQTTKLEPGNAYYIGTLGAAQYRAGDHAAAIVSLEKALALRNDHEAGGAVNGFFLAMARWQSGDKDAARKDYDRALARMAKEKTAREEAPRFQKEARSLLGAPAEPGK